MQASGTKYEIETYSGKMQSRPNIILPHGAFVQTFDKKDYTFEYQYELSCEVEIWVQEAKNMLSVENPNYKKIIKLLQKCLKVQAQNAQIHTLLGEVYFQQQNYEASKIEFQKAIYLNPIDYIARWQLGEILLLENQIDSALQTITLAHLYNRNQPRLLFRMRDLYSRYGFNYAHSWNFSPLYLNYREKGNIVIRAEGIWLTYAMYKAVWEFEPDYLYIKSKQAVSDYLFHQEMESVLGTYLTYSKLEDADKKVYPAIRALETALDNDMLEEYIMYEIILVERPTLAYYLTNDFIERLFAYIKAVRSLDYN
jgi:tetratricopeptide (TPR) repeat protein